MADVVSYALYRRYNPDSSERTYLDQVWSRFDDEDGVVHGCVHYTPSYGTGVCDCIACKNRLTLEAEKKLRASRRR